MEDGGRGELGLEGPQCPFGGRSPVGSQLGGCEGCEGAGHGTVVLDELVLEISEPKEPLKLQTGVGNEPGGNR